MKTRIRQLCCRFVILSVLAALVALSAAKIARADWSAARTWNEQLLSSIRSDTARPTVHARNLFHTSIAMYDAWAAYDPVATQYLHTEKLLGGGDMTAARNEAISYAAYNVILHRFVFGPAGNGPGAFQTYFDIRQQMTNLGYDPDNASTVGNLPAAVGNRIAQTVINYGLADGANEANSYANTSYAPVNPNLIFENTGTTMNDPNRWQPLEFLGNNIDQFGNVILPSVQTSLSPYWGDVKPFAMYPSDRDPTTGVYHDQGAPPQLGGVGDAEFKDAANLVIRYSSKLDPSLNETIDTSPGVVGNRALGTYDDVGHPINPYTGAPYESNEVNLADWGRTIAEFWADGPTSSAPPGHWNEISNDITDKMEELGIPKRIGGLGPVVSDLEWDVKKYIGVGAAVHDAAVAAWNHKGVYDYTRPISMIRYMSGKGQSSNSSLPSYDPEGIKLEPGLVELITSATTAVGERHEDLAGHEGEIAILAWQGAIDGVAPFTDPGDVSGSGWILGEDWMPYQLTSFVTPPFAGYLSGHSTFSRAAAEVLARLTGDEFFPGGIFEYEIEQGQGLRFEYGPTETLKLPFATYFDAADEAGLSRLYGGIHVPADDLPGRILGSAVGIDVWRLAQQYFNGATVVPEPSTFVLAGLALVGLFGIRRRSR